MRFQISIYGSDLVKRDLIRMGDRAVNAKPAFEDIADDLRRVFASVFSSQGRRGGGSWKRLKPETVAAKLRRHQDPRILLASHNLLHSMTLPYSKFGGIRASRDGVEIWNRLPYGRAMQQGNPRSNVPARPYARLTEYDKRRELLILQDYIVGRLRIGL